MALFHDLLEDFFGSSIGEEHLLEAFRLNHPDFTSHPMAAAQNGDKIFVHGDFSTSDEACSYAGRFEWYVKRAGPDLMAFHQWIEVQKPYRRRKIALSHYRKLVKFFDAVGLEYVLLKAAWFGPEVWPQFGFEMVEPEDLKLLKEQLGIVFAEIGIEADPTPESAAWISALPEVDGVQPGLEALARTYWALDQQPIPMILDLKQPRTRAFLEEQGILEPRGETKP